MSDREQKRAAVERLEALRFAASQENCWSEDQWSAFEDRLVAARKALADAEAAPVEG